jgi:Lrp/AsnC family transcriptional regulator, leucine-responsive regulatory protein
MISIMDDLDRNIIAALTSDGRMSYARIAETVGTATTTVHQRVRKLIARGIITGTRVIIDWEAVGLPVTALVSVEASGTEALADVATSLATIPYVQNGYATTGEFDLLLTVRARSSQHLGSVLEEIRRFAPGRSRTIVVLATYYEGRFPPL